MKSVLFSTSHAKWLQLCACLRARMCVTRAVRCISKTTTSRSAISDMSFIFIFLLVSSSLKHKRLPSSALYNVDILTMFAFNCRLFESFWQKLSLRVEVEKKLVSPQVGLSLDLMGTSSLLFPCSTLSHLLYTSSPFLCTISPCGL